MPAPKLVLCMIDSLSSEMLEEAIADGAAPTLGALVERGNLIRDCVSAFPSVTPVCCASIATGERPDRHHIPAMNWFHRGEGRYVEYGSSFEATRAFGLFRTLYDTVYNMNLAHLAHSTPTFFELLDDAGVRTACTPFLIYRGRQRHQMGLEGLLRRVAVAADFTHAVWGPHELFYGELYASRRVPCRPTLARPGTRDVYSACVSRELVERDLCDFLLFSLPDNDHHSHRFGPGAQVASIAHADAQLAELILAGGGLDAFLAEHALIVMADHSQSDVDTGLPLIEALSEDWRVVTAAPGGPPQPQVAACPSARAGGAYVLEQDGRFATVHRRVREKLSGMDGVELTMWLAADGHALDRRESLPEDLEAVVVRNGGELRFAPGSSVTDRRGESWDLEGDLDVLGVSMEDGRVDFEEHPDALARTWSYLLGPHAADVAISLEPGHECVDWGNTSHIGGGSHGSLRGEDSLQPLLFVGCGPEEHDPDRQWALADVWPVVLSHFGVSPGADGP